MNNNDIRELEIVTPEEEKKEERLAHQDQDYEYIRNNLKDIIGKGSDALEGILELARDSDHPRAWEVVKVPRKSRRMQSLSARPTNFKNSFGARVMSVRN